MDLLGLKYLKEEPPLLTKVSPEPEEDVAEYLSNIKCATFSSVSDNEYVV